MARPEKVRLGDLLVQQKLISLDQLQFVLEQQKRSGRKLGRVLVDNGFISEDQISEALAKQLNVPYINLKYYNANLEIVRRLPENQARRFRALALEERNGAILVGMTDPTDLFAFDEISRLLKRDIDVAVVTEGQLLETIDRVYRRTDEISGLAKEISEELGEGYIDFGALSDTVGTEEAPVVKLLQTMFEDASQVGASDVHIEPQETRLQIRFRIDGALHLQTEADSKISSAIALRLKLMSGLDISEKRLPQDGRFNVRVREQAIDVRISTMPTQYGESVVMRLLNQSNSFLTLDKLGMPPEMLKRFREIIQRSNGMVLVTGPTGSGKTTTLYAGLSEINTIDQKIITVEDPVEFVHPHKNCIVTQRELGIDTDSWEAALKNTLRQAPDVILMGEIRDRETMEHAVAFAETGHLCLATLHANSANQALDRIINFFPEERRQQLLMDLSLNLKALISQRLIAREQGRGRVAAVEILLNTPLVGDMIFKGEVSEIKELMKRSRELGMQTFDQALFDLYEDRKITYEDALRNADSVNDLRLQIKLKSQRARSPDLAAGTEAMGLV
jgi:MSHA biogenesis protein MshE